MTNVALPLHFKYSVSILILEITFNLRIVRFLDFAHNSLQWIDEINEIRK